MGYWRYRHGVHTAQVKGRGFVQFSDMDKLARMWYIIIRKRQEGGKIKDTTEQGRPLECKAAGVLSSP